MIKSAIRIWIVAGLLIQGCRATPKEELQAAVDTADTAAPIDTPDIPDSVEAPEDMGVVDPEDVEVAAVQQPNLFEGACETLGVRHCEYSPLGGPMFFECRLTSEGQVWVREECETDAVLVYPLAVAECHELIPGQALCCGRGRFKGESYQAHVSCPVLGHRQCAHGTAQVVECALASKAKFHMTPGCAYNMPIAACERSGTGQTCYEKPAGVFHCHQNGTNLEFEPRPIEPDW